MFKKDRKGSAERKERNPGFFSKSFPRLFQEKKYFFWPPSLPEKNIFF